ncbi:ABC transporter permease [Pseudonocardia nematodicida]|uniref:ABC transporter permease n=1 Tax=Pseudonocardia nematodicida TaxID=1206997 RepID=A0ABV1KF68_9PSEU
MSAPVGAAAVDPGAGAARRPGRGRWRAWTRPGVVASLLVLAVIGGWALAPGLFTGRDPIAGVPGEQLLPPGPAHPFGTDALGRDLFARVVHGTAVSLQAAAIALAIALVVGVGLGVLAGWFGGWFEAVVMRVVDVTLSVPGVLLSLLVIAAIGFGVVQVAVAVGVAGFASFARLARAEVLRVRTAPYVEAALLCGSGTGRILLRYVLPAVAAPLLALAALDFGLVVLAVSALSFLGYGQPPPAPEWGALVAAGRDHLATAWWLTTLPGLALTALVLATNRLSRLLDAEGRTR